MLIIAKAVGCKGKRNGTRNEGHFNNTAVGFCPHGYDDFGCQPCCPLYEHCWGEQEE